MDDEIYNGSKMEPEDPMPVTLSIKNVPDHVAERLRRRARNNHRSLQGELLAILEDAVGTQVHSISDLRRLTEQLGLRTADDSTEIIRKERDERG